MRLIANTIDNIYTFVEAGICPIPTYYRFDNLTSACLVAFDPGAGTFGAIKQHPTDSNSIYFLGDFGASNLVKHTVATVTNSIISTPASFVIDLSINPSNDLEMVATSQSSGLYSTPDGGSNWTALNSPNNIILIDNMVVHWFADHVSIMVSGSDGGGVPIMEYTPNAGEAFRDFRTGVYPVTQMEKTNG